MMVEIIGLVLRIGLELLFELIWFWSPADNREYRAYVDALPAGEKPLSKREWRAVERAQAAG